MSKNKARRLIAHHTMLMGLFQSRANESLRPFDADTYMEYAREQADRIGQLNKIINARHAR